MTPVSDDVTREDVTPEVLDRLEALLAEVFEPNGGRWRVPWDQRRYDNLVNVAMSALPALIAAARQVRAAEEAQRVAERERDEWREKCGAEHDAVTHYLGEVEVLGEEIITATAYREDAEDRAERAEAALADRIRREHALVQEVAERDRVLAEVRRIVTTSWHKTVRNDLLAALDAGRADSELSETEKASRGQGGERA